MVTNPRATPANDEAKRWLRSLLAGDAKVVVPEIADYEVRRELVRLNSRRGLARLDSLTELAAYLPLNTSAMRLAAQFWARARNQGTPTASADALDCDIILAAQAAQLAAEGSDQVVIATTNVRHLSLFAEARYWNQIG
jgi:predicted nucleic acid-binding protein